MKSFYQLKWKKINLNQRFDVNLSKLSVWIVTFWIFLNDSWAAIHASFLIIFNICIFGLSNSFLWKISLYEGEADVVNLVWCWKIKTQNYFSVCDEGSKTQVLVQIFQIFFKFHFIRACCKSRKKREKRE